MKKLFLDTNRVNFSGWPHYSSVGNKILHLFYCISFADAHNLELKIPNKSNLDKIFDTKCLIEFPEKTERVYTEQNEYRDREILKIGNNSRQQFLEEMEYLKCDITKTQTQNLSVQGHFHHYELMPKLDLLKKYLDYNLENYIKAQILANNINKNYDEPIYVHYRGKDFANHENGLGDCRLDKKYYIDSFEECLRRFPDSTFICLSDEPDFYKQFTDKYRIVILNNSYEIDWLLLHLSEKMISTNSTFGWSASLHNKNFLIQPRCGVNVRRIGDIVIPYGFYIKNSIII